MTTVFIILILIEHQLPVVVVQAEPVVQVHHVLGHLCLARWRRRPLQAHLPKEELLRVLNEPSVRWGGR